jgi:hypothetical protein
MFQVIVGVATITGSIATVWLLVLALSDRIKKPPSKS